MEELIAAEIEEREIYKDCDVDAKYRNVRQDGNKKFVKKLYAKCSCSGGCLWQLLKQKVPIFEWLPKYEWRKTFPGDFAAGLTVGIVHIPQGLAYTQLASLPLVVGLYVSLFPVLLYPLFGTSRHVSMGTFAIASILVNNILTERLPLDYCGDISSRTLQHTTPLNTISELEFTTNDFVNQSSSTVIDCSKLRDDRKIDIAVALSISVGLIQILMHLFRLGIVTVFLSDSMLSGFLCGSAHLVITSQIPKLFGISIDRATPPFAFFKTYVEIFRTIPETNIATLIMSSSCIIFLVIGKEINRRFKKKLPVPIPWELFLVILSTLASYLMSLSEKHDVANVGYIPSGLSPSMPKGSDVISLFIDAIPIAIVAFAVETSLCQIFAAKHSYDIDSNQELLALGMCNIFGAFMSCFPSASSLSRTIIYDEVGATTQLGSYVSSMVVAAVLFWMGKLFQPLPQAALASIILVNVKNVALLFRTVRPLWRVSHLDAVTWVVTWFSVVLFGVPTGLLIGAVFSIMTVLLRTRNVKGVSLKKVSNDGVYRDVRKYSTVSIHEHIFVYQFTGPLFFANKDRFTEKLSELLGFDPIKLSAGAKSQKRLDDQRNAGEKSVIPNSAIPHGNVNPGQEATDFIQASSEYSLVILDMNRCSFLDSDGAKIIHGLYEAFQVLGMKMMLASCTGDVRKSLHGCWQEVDSATFVSVDAAVKFDLSEMNEESA